MLKVASTETLRQQNRALILAALRECGGLAHTEICDWTGLSSASVSAITADLLEENIIIRQEAGATAGRGRPKSLFRQNPQAAHVATIRISYEQVECSLADYTGTLKDRFSTRRDVDNADIADFTAMVRDSLNRLVMRSGLDKSRIRTISVTSKGLVASGRPVLLWSPVFGNREIDFRQVIGEDWDARITLTHETQFAAQAVARRLKLASPQYATRVSATLSLGHSIGLGVATEKPGSKIQAIAPDFGHMIHVPDGPLCRCGARGCIETFAGFYAILRTAFSVPDNTIPPNCVPMIEIDRLADNARGGDRMAGFAFRQAGEALGIGLSRLMSICGPMSVTVIGQGVKYFDLLQAAIVEQIGENREIRHAGLPQISIDDDQDNLVFDGNIEACLSHLDANVLALGRMGGGG